MNKEEAIKKYGELSKELWTKLAVQHKTYEDTEEINSLIRQTNYLKNRFGLKEEDLK